LAAVAVVVAQQHSSVLRFRVRESISQAACTEDEEEEESVSQRVGYMDSYLADAGLWFWLVPLALFDRTCKHVRYIDIDI
jgi:hypothetical protein